MVCRLDMKERCMSCSAGILQDGKVRAMLPISPCLRQCYSGTDKRFARQVYHCRQFATALWRLWSLSGTSQASVPSHVAAQTCRSQRQWLSITAQPSTTDRTSTRGVVRSILFSMPTCVPGALSRPGVAGCIDVQV